MFHTDALFSGIEAHLVGFLLQNWNWPFLQGALVPVAGNRISRPQPECWGVILSSELTRMLSYSIIIYISNTQTLGVTNSMKRCCRFSEILKGILIKVLQRNRNNRR